MSTTASEFDVTRVGQWSDPMSFEVTRERIVQYAQATGDTIAPHAAGEYASPVFAVVPAFGVAAAAAMQVIPPDQLMMIVHGEQDFRFHQPILPGATLSTRAAVIGVHPRSSGVAVLAKADTSDAGGELVVEQYMTSFVRGAQTAAAVGEEPPGHRFPEALRAGAPLASVAQSFDADQTFRYSEASGDPMPIHLDDAVARAMGLPGIIVHGLCTMAFTARVVIGSCCPADPTRLRRLAVRFSKVVQPSEQITTSIWDAGGARFAFETTSSSGAVVIKDGLAELSERS